jgi:hypothetical protein
MFKFALVENKTITALSIDLPINWRHISGLNKSVNDEPFLNSLGWYKIQYQEYTLQDNEIFIDYKYEYDDELSKVVGIPKISNIDIQSQFQENKIRFLNELREYRNKLIIESDWTQLTDVQQLHSDSWKLAWAQYRQELRDLPQQYESNEIISMNDVIFPTKPSE